LLNGYALIGGLTSLVGFTLHGAIFLSLKTTGDLQERSHKFALKLWIPAVVLLVGFGIATYFATDMLERLGVDPGVIPILAIVALVLAGYFLKVKRNGWAFAMTALSIATTTLTLFLILFPRVMVSSLNPTWSLTIYNASSSEYTLKIMTIIALVLVPVVLTYQGWTYYVFRKRLTTESELEY
jgi:cytochrome d ubiquinol oxidase subunit II